MASYGIPVALGPDWTWSGSMNPVRENLCAKEYFVSRNNEFIDEDVWEMATTDAARSVGLDGVLGALAPGMLADMAVFTYSERPYQPCRCRTRGCDFNGCEWSSTLWNPDLMNALVADQSLCGQPLPVVKIACFVYVKWLLKMAMSVGDSLTAALDGESMPAELQYAKELLGLWMCEETCRLRYIPGYRRRQRW